MGYQKCPVCNGTGTEIVIKNNRRETITCSVCKGKKIINSNTGIPPEHPDKEIRNEIDIILNNK